jgi:hypothetical protein
MLLHWTVSQSIFLARIAFYKDGKPTMADINSMRHRWSLWAVEEERSMRMKSVFNGIGYSDTALLMSLALMVALIVVCRLVAAFGTYDVGLPIGGTNSAVISAACHVMHEHRIREDDGRDMAEKPLQWGVTIRRHWKSWAFVFQW